MSKKIFWECEWYSLRESSFLNIERCLKDVIVKMRLQIRQKTSKWGLCLFEVWENNNDSILGQNGNKESSAPWKKPGLWKFLFTNIKDEGTIYLSDVISILPQLKSASTARTANIIRIRFVRLQSSINWIDFNVDCCKSSLMLFGYCIDIKPIFLIRMLIII